MSKSKSKKLKNTLKFANGSRLSTCLRTHLCMKGDFQIFHRGNEDSIFMITDLYIQDQDENLNKNQNYSNI